MPAVVERLAAICLALPEAREEEAWTGVRWRVGSKTFAHAVAIDGGWPPAYAHAAGTDGPVTVLTFRAAGEDLAALSSMGPPFFKPVWFEDIVGMVLDDADWGEVAELITDSYRVVAPRRLASRLG
jgi:predicted DNA-binding protein (MmcQ/YjbR family)